MMTRRGQLLIAGISILLLGGGAGRQFVHPWWMKRQTHAALEQAASNLCSCMFAKKGTPANESVQAGVFLQAVTDDNPWPQRCEPWAKGAISAYREAWKWDDGLPMEVAEDAEWNARFIEMIQPFAVRDPDPRVPIPPTAPTVFDFYSLPPLPIANKEFVSNDRRTIQIRVVDDRLTLLGKGFLAIDREDHVVKLEEPPPPKKHPEHDDWKPIAADPGARSAWYDDSHFFDDEARRLTAERFFSVWWAHAYADGRIVAAVAEDAGGDLGGAIWEIARDGSVKKTPFTFQTSLFNRSMVELDGWTVFKRIPLEGSATIEAIDFRLGAAARPIVLGPIDRPMRAVEHTYGPCRANTTFVDMDPSIAVLSGRGEWTYLPFEGAGHRVLSCEGDVAFVAEWPPLEIRRCTKDGCTKLPFPSMSIQADDRFGADEHHVFRVLERNGVLGMDIFTHDGKLLKRTAITTARTPAASLRVVAGRAIVLFEDSLGSWRAMSVRPDGSVHAIQ